MPTTPNIRIIGEEPPVQKKLKHIELCKKWAGINMILDGHDNVKEFSNIELISRGYFLDYDLIFCYNNDRSTGVIYIGNWNDGVAN